MTELDWTSFYAGFVAGSSPWALIDLTILTILWPLRKFVWLLRDPAAEKKLRILLGMED